jgi:hypothetical protein
VIGRSNRSGESSIVIGNNNDEGTPENSIIIGYSLAIDVPEASINIGDSLQEHIAIGIEPMLGVDPYIRIGYNQENIRIGKNIEINESKIRIGESSSTGSNSIALGHNINSSLDNTIIIGNDSHFQIILGPILIIYDDTNKRIVFRGSSGAQHIMNLT